MHTGHSFSSDSAPARRLRAVAMATARPRVVPPSLTLEGRRSYLEIATRAQTESVHAYTVLGLGLQAYQTAALLKRIATPNPSPPSHDAGR